MTLEQLRIFVAVAEREHVTQAARALNLTQSATSAAIAALEVAHATRLFDRIGRRIELTEAGRLFLVEARAVLARAAAAETVLADLAGLMRGNLNIAASQTVANYWLPAHIHAFRLRYPGLAIRMSIGNTETVAQSVRDGLVDIGFVEGRIDDPALCVDAIGEDELVLVVGASHPWSSRNSVEPGDLLQTAWVLREPGSGTRAVFEEALARFGLAASRLSAALELPSNEAVRAAVEAGAGAAVISRLVVEASLRSGSLRALALPMPKRAFYSVRHRERSLTQAQRAFLDQVSAGIAIAAP